jgi:hypothetical protein
LRIPSRRGFENVVGRDRIDLEDHVVGCLTGRRNGAQVHHGLDLLLDPVVDAGERRHDVAEVGEIDLDEPGLPRPWWIGKAGRRDLVDRHHLIAVLHQVLD